MKKPLSRTFAGRVYSVDVEVVPNEDPEIGGTITLKEARRAEIEIAAQVAVDEVVSGEGFAFMRKAISLRGVDLAAFLDVRFETVSRWERGELDVPRSAWLVLGSMVLEEVGRPTETQRRARRLSNEGKQPRATP